MENINILEIKDLANQKKEAKKRFKAMEKYMKEELKETRARIQQLEDVIKEYYQLENKIENILEETVLMEQGDKYIEKDYEFNTTNRVEVFKSINLVKGDYLLEFKCDGDRGIRSIELRKAKGKRWNNGYIVLGTRGSILIEIEYTGEYYMQVKTDGNGSSIHLKKQSREV